MKEVQAYIHQTMIEHVVRLQTAAEASQGAF